MQYEFSDEDFKAMTHPEGMPGQLTAMLGDRGTSTVLENTSSLSKYYRALALRSEMVANLYGSLVIWGTLLLIPALVMLWKLAV